jgi:hypothetical protein
VRPAVQAWTAIPIIPEEMEPFTRVQQRVVSYRNLNDPSRSTEEGPDRALLTRRNLNLGGGGGQ